MKRALIAAFIARTAKTASAACLTVSLAGPAVGQSPSQSSSELSLSAGLGHADRIDGAASPSRFGGPGIGVELGYSAFTRRLMMLAWGGAGVHVLGSSSAPRSNERATEGALGFAVYPVTTPTWGGSVMSVGLDVRANGGLLAHRYPAVENKTESYVSGMATVGPTALVSRGFGGARVTASLTVPLAGAVMRPYSEARLGRSATDLRFATVESLRGAYAGFTYAPAVTRRLGLRYEYRLGFMRYDDVVPARSLSQSLSVAIVRRRAR